MVVLVILLGCSLASETVATAGPATPLRLTPAASATHFSGRAFDTCTAPRLSTMSRWLSSNYRGVGVYIGGPLRACSQRHLSKRWVRRVSAMGWGVIPIYVGLQAPCRKHSPQYEISTKRATKQGKTAARAATRQARRLGLLPGSAIYLDLEGYPDHRPRCRKAVLRYASGWTKGLHSRGYLSGVYSPMGSGARHFADAYRSRSLSRPDALWAARWDRKPSLHGWGPVPDRMWPSGQRGKQYRGGHRERHGGRVLNVDSNVFNAPVATVSRRHRVVTGAQATSRRAPRLQSRAVASYDHGKLVPAVCRVRGVKVGHGRTWVKLSNGSYLPTRNLRPRPPLVPRCTYPFQVTAPDKLTVRAGPGTQYRRTGRIPHGGLARVICQASGSDVLGNRVWNRLSRGRWVSNKYLDAPRRSHFTKGIPRCR